MAIQPITATSWWPLACKGTSRPIDQVNPLPAAVHGCSPEAAALRPNRHAVSEAPAVDSYSRRMIVRCTKIISPVEGVGEVEDHPGIHVGGLYPVLEIMAGPDYYAIRIWDDDAEDPGTLWDPEMFETVDHRIPARWSASLEHGHANLGPTSWQQPGFWSRYFDREPEAVDAVHREIRLILTECRSRSKLELVDGSPLADLGQGQRSTE